MDPSALHVDCMPICPRFPHSAVHPQQGVSAQWCIPRPAGLPHSAVHPQQGCHTVWCTPSRAALPHHIAVCSVGYSDKAAFNHRPHPLFSRILFIVLHIDTDSQPYNTPHPLLKQQNQNESGLGVCSFPSDICEPIRSQSRDGSKEVRYWSPDRHTHYQGDIKPKQ